MPDFTSHVVNKRFHVVYDELVRLSLIKGKSDLAQKLNTYNHVINSILKGRRNITVDQLERLFSCYHINANYIFGTSDEMFIGGAPVAAGDFDTRSFGERTHGSSVEIVLVDEKAIGGYAMEHGNPGYLRELPKFSLPDLSGRDLIAFEVSGDSMMPTITHGDLVVCTPLENDDPIYDNHVYVVVTDVVVVKRVQQIRSSAGVEALRLISDNSKVFMPYEVQGTEVRQLLKVKSRVTGYGVS